MTALVSFCFSLSLAWFGGAGGGDDTWTAGSLVTIYHAEGETYPRFNHLPCCRDCDVVHNRQRHIISQTQIWNGDVRSWVIVNLGVEARGGAGRV
jgi:hypothetical protein